VWLKSQSSHSCCVSQCKSISNTNTTSHWCFGCRVGGTAGAVITCPLEVVKTRLQSSLTPYQQPVSAASHGANSSRATGDVCRQSRHLRSFGLIHCLRWSVQFCWNKYHLVSNNISIHKISVRAHSCTHVVVHFNFKDEFLFWKLETATSGCLKRWLLNISYFLPDLDNASVFIAENSYVFFKLVSHIVLTSQNFTVRCSLHKIFNREPSHIQTSRISSFLDLCCLKTWLHLVHFPRNWIRKH